MKQTWQNVNMLNIGDEYIGIDCTSLSTTFIFLKYIYLFLAALGLRCCERAFSSCCKRALLFLAVRGLLIAVASLVAEHGL